MSIEQKIEETEEFSIDIPAAPVKESISVRRSTGRVSAKNERQGHIAQSLKETKDPADLDNIQRIRKLREKGSFRSDEPIKKLPMPERPGYRRYWANDKPGRIKQLLDRGWDFVTEADALTPDSGGRISAIVNSNAELPSKAYLMEIPIEFWREDMDTRHSRIDSLEKAITEGEYILDKDRGNQKSADFYKPNIR